MPMHIDASHPMCMTLQLDAQYTSRHEKLSTLWQEVMLYKKVQPTEEEQLLALSVC